MIQKHTFKLSACLLAAALFFPSLAFAQHDSPNTGYVFGTIGQRYQSTGVEGGGGIGYERRLVQGFGAAVDFHLFRKYGYEVGVLFSANGTYHIRNTSPSGKVVPFGTAGYSGVIVEDGDTLNGFNFGGGVEYWVKPNAGLRVEFRDNLFKEAFYSNKSNKWEFRFGFSF